MIVRNEAAILRRALLSVADHIDYWVICDTGSTDQTKDLIRSFFLDRNIPGELHNITFENFAQARNKALDHAEASKQQFDYLLLMDADMELVVEKGVFPQHLSASSYRVKQKAGISYWNTRLLRRDAPARYHGVTHEYLDHLPDQETLHSIWFMDHTDGANRAGKLERDIRLLEDGLAREPDNGRYVYYLAQSYRDAGRLAEAAEAYTRRVSMGGWDEETWHAQLQASRCWLALGDNAGFLSAAAKAFDLRPHRAEPLYELAKFHRLHNQNETAMVFCEAALKLPWPKHDILFIEDFVYATGIREEASIAGGYCKSQERREAGRRACFGLARDRDAPESSRRLAHHNQASYAHPARSMFPSLQTWQLAFRSPAGGNVMNPSVAVWDRTAYVLVRNVNYSITETGSYVTPNNGPIETRNYLLRLDAELQPRSWSEIRPPFDLPPPRYSLVRGFEDARLFVWRDSLWCSSTVRELSHEGWCEVVLARIDCPLTQSCALTHWRLLEPEGPRQHQKNWMPQVKGDTLRFIYSVDPTRIVDECGRNVSLTIPSLAFEHVRGGSPAIAFDGGWLALTHEVCQRDKQRIYLHRFVWFDATTTLRLATAPFYFISLGIEYGAGLAWHPDARRLIVSFGVGDAEARMGMVSADDIRAALTGTGRANFSAPAAQFREPRVNRVSASAGADRRLPKAYCIVCPQMPGRRAAAEAHFHERGLDVELFDGIHGPTWGLETTKARADGKRMSAGSIGLLLSHWLLWRIAEQLHDEEILVFEDDVILPIDFEVEFHRSYEQLPADWQFVFVGFVGRFPSEPVAERVSIIRYPYGTHAYLVKKSALRTLIETNQEARTHLDLQLIDNTLPRLKCYTFTPSLAGQRTYAGEWPTSAASESSTPSADIALPAARSLNPAERIFSTMTKAVISLHDRTTELRYPDNIQKHIDRLFGPLTQRSARSPKHVISVREVGPGRYSISGVIEQQAGHDLSLTELFDALLEQVAHSLIDKLDSAVALHAASIGWAGKCILIPGPTGAGKTSLAGWFVANNFEFLTDELVVLLETGRMTLSFPRPLLAKPGAEELIAILARSGRSKTVETAANTIIGLDPSSSAGNKQREAGLIIFPRFVAGSELEIASVSPAMTCLKLMECNLNARNLADHGLATLAAFSRNTPALSLTYGSYEQLDGVADTFAKFVLEGGAGVAGLQKFISAFRPPLPVIARREQSQSANGSSVSALPKAAIPAATPRKEVRKFTIGMATYDDYDGVYFTLQAIRLYHPEILNDTEFLVVDNHPDGPCAGPLKNLETWIPNYRYVPKGEISGTAIRDFVFQEASGEFVICMDCHVFIVPGALKRLTDYFDAHADTKDLLQGPMIYDDLKSYSTHFKPGWQAGMYGTWDVNPAGADPDQPPFEIPMQGLGLFACRRAAWPGFNPAFRGFGGEEGYIHEKFRQRGGRALCLPFLRWMHRFNRPLGTPYANQWEDRVRNYLIGFRELGWDTAPVVEHFKTFLGEQVWQRVTELLGEDRMSGGHT